MAREEFLKRYKEQYPDKDYTDNDDELWADVHKEYTELNDYKSKNSEVNKKLLEVLNSHPEISKFIRDVSKGATVPEALARNFDLENISPVEGEPDYESWEKGKADRMKSLSEREEYNKTLQENIDMSEKTLRDFVEKNGLDEDSAGEFLEMVQAIFKDAADGKIEERTLTALYTAANHDQTVKDEVEKATVKTKNEKIEAQMSSEKDKNMGDGLPAISGSGSAITPPEPQKGGDNGFIRAYNKKNRLL